MQIVIIMSLIINHIKEMDVLVPSVSVYVECENKKCLKDYYEKFISPEYKKQYIKNHKSNQLVSTGM